jgi:hypothetical protein
VLVVDACFSDSLRYSARNTMYFFTVDMASINALDLTSSDHFLLSDSGLMLLLDRIR